MRTSLLALLLALASFGAQAQTATVFKIPVGVRIVGAESMLTIDTSAATTYKSSIYFSDNGTKKWQLFRNTDQGLYLWDFAAANAAMGFGSNGGVTFTRPGAFTLNSSASPTMVISGSSGAAIGIQIVNASPGTTWNLNNDSLGGFTLNKGGTDLFWVGRSSTTAASFAGALTVTGALLASSAVNKGTGTTNAANPSVATITVTSGAVCTCSWRSATAVGSIACSVSGTTLTITGGAVPRAPYSYVCL